MSDIAILGTASFLFLTGRLCRTALLLQAILICLPTHYQNVSDCFVDSKRKDVGLASGYKNHGNNQDLQIFIIYFYSNLIPMYDEKFINVCKFNLSVFVQAAQLQEIAQVSLKHGEYSGRGCCSDQQILKLK